MNKTKRLANKSFFGLKPIRSNDQKSNKSETIAYMRWGNSLVLGDDSLNDTYRLKSLFSKLDKLGFEKAKRFSH